MYLHVGEDIVVRTNDVIAIIDESSKEFIEDCLQNQEIPVLKLSKGVIKSIVFTKEAIFESPFSSQTLKKRCRLKSLYASN